MRIARLRALLVLWIAAISATSCSLFPQSPLTNIRMTADETGKQVVTSYNHLQAFCVFADVQGLKAGSVIRAIWFTVDAKGVAPNTKINTSDYSYKSGVKHVYFKLATWDDSSWPAGTYTVKLYVDGVAMGEQGFSVR